MPGLELEQRGNADEKTRTCGSRLSKLKRVDVPHGNQLIRLNYGLDICLSVLTVNKLTEGLLDGK